MEKYRSKQGGVVASDYVTEQESGYRQSSGISHRGLQSIRNWTTNTPHHLSSTLVENERVKHERKSPSV